RGPAPHVARRRVGDPAGPPHGGPHGVPHDRPLARPLTFTRVDVSGTVSPDPSYKWTGAHPASMKMHSPGHSSPDSMTASRRPSGIGAMPSAPWGLPWAAA